MGKECQRFGDREFQHVGNRQRRPAGAAPVLQRDLQHLGPEAPAVAVRAAQVDVGQELHLDMFEAIATAGRAAAIAGIEGEGAGAVVTLLRQWFGREQLPDGIEGADIAGRIGAGGLADGRLIDHHHILDQRRAAQLAQRARPLGRPAEPLEQAGIQHILHQGGFARAGHAAQTEQAMQRQAHIEVAQIVFARAQQFEAGAVAEAGRCIRAYIRVCFGRVGRCAGAFASEQIVGGERGLLMQ